MARILLIAFLVAFPFFGSQAQVSNNEMRSHFQQFFENFQRDPVATMQALPVKYDSEGNVVHDALFSPADLEGNQFVTLKDKARAKITYNPAALVMAQINQANDPDSLLLNSQQINFLTLANQNLMKGSVLEQPWSSDYWPTYKGGLANRYTTFGNLRNWLSYKSIFNKLIGVNFRDEVAPEDRSPAEKYDLLMGDENFNFSKWWVKNSINAENRNGAVETWEGICHGWAPAAYLLPRPKKTLTFQLQDGTSLKFFPDDLKGLADALYANNKTRAVFVGTRCNVRTPQLDEAGRIVASNCWDINPGAFHTVMLNRVGADKQSLVMDATYDYEVWNQPVVSYQIAYFNPQTGYWANTPQEASVNVSQFSNDRFKKYRSSQAVTVVGVQMAVTYTVETAPNHYPTDSTHYDVLRTAEYLYDLELDRQGNIVGGEWYQNSHPDFLWSPAAGAQPLAFGEPSRFNAWGSDGLPSQQAKDMALTASGSGQALNAIVQRLMQMSAQQK
jgi:hypothetical protein